MDPERYFGRRRSHRSFIHERFYSPPYLCYNPRSAWTNRNVIKARAAAAFASHMTQVLNQSIPSKIQSDSTLTCYRRKRNISIDFEEYTDTSEAEDENFMDWINERSEKVDVKNGVDHTLIATPDNKRSLFVEEEDGEVKNMNGMMVEDVNGKQDEVSNGDGINGYIDGCEEQVGEPKYYLRKRALIQGPSIVKNKEKLKPQSEIRNRGGTGTKLRKGRRKVPELAKGQHIECPDDMSGGVDIKPVEIDENVSFDHIGGLSQYVNALKEMFFLPLSYPELYEHYKINPPKGILFCGPPGTGKTLVARALACAASKQGQKVSFYMRKGADVMSKWVGEAERHLTLLFEEARKNQPSIIFFDEIDGLAPARSSKLEHIHASVVSTLLALMDGLDSRGQVFVIGATNRVDDIDSALRRPGRFDCEFNFPLPCCEARTEILSIYTRDWKSPPSEALIFELAARCVGYCGADLKSLCSQSVLLSFKERYPQACLGDNTCMIDFDTVKVEKRHFLKAMSKIIPTSLRSTVVNSHPLSPVVAPCLHRHLREAMAAISSVFPFLNAPSNTDSGVSNIAFCRPKLLLVGDKLGVGLNHIRAAILHELEKFPVHSLALGSILGNAGAKLPEAALFQVFVEAKRSTPSVMYLPDLEIWCENGHEQLKSQLCWLLNELPCDMPILLLGASSVPFDKISKQVASIFSCHNVLHLGEVTIEDKSLFFDSIVEAAGVQVNDMPGVGMDGDEEISKIKQLLVEHTKSFGVAELEWLYPMLVNGISSAKRSAAASVDGPGLRACVLNYLFHFVSNNNSKR